MEVQAVKITREELEGLSEDFLLRMFWYLVIQTEWIRASVIAAFFPDPLRRKIYRLILAGGEGLEKILSQAKDEKDIFKDVRPTDDEQKDEKKFAETLEAQIKNWGCFQADIVYEIGSIGGKELSVAEILSLILVCVIKGYHDFAREAVASLPLTKQIQARTILF